MEILYFTYKNPRPLKFKGKFQEADTFNRNPPPGRGNYPPNQFLTEAIEAEKRWAALGLLDNIKDTFTRQMISLALDNQAKSKPGRSNKAVSHRNVKWTNKNEKSV